jgi:Protein of unknown function (DUF5818)
LQHASQNSQEERGMKKIDWTLASAAFLLSITLSVAASSATAATNSAQQTASTDNATANTDQQQTYAGTIVSMNGTRFILRDDNNDTWYHLDNQQSAAKFLGKKVLVTGKLDTTTDMIHVQVIAEAKS